MSIAPRGGFSRGTSVLAALVFVAILSSIAYAVHEISPSDSAAQTAAAAGRLAVGFEAPPPDASEDPDAVSASEQATAVTEKLRSTVDPASDPRCVAIIKIQQDPKDSEANVWIDASKLAANTCVPGCAYKIYQEGSVSRIVGKDSCKGKDGIALKECLSTVHSSCVVEEVCTKVTTSYGDIFNCKGLAAGQDPATVLGSLPGLKSSVQIQADPSIQEILRLAATDPAAAQDKINGLAPFQQRVLQAAIPGAIADNQSMIDRIARGEPGAAAQLREANENLQALKVNPGIAGNPAFPEFAPIPSDRTESTKPPGTVTDPMPDSSPTNFPSAPQDSSPRCDKKWSNLWLIGGFIPCDANPPRDTTSVTHQDDVTNPPRETYGPVAEEDIRTKLPIPVFDTCKGPTRDLGCNGSAFDTPDLSWTSPAVCGPSGENCERTGAGSFVEPSCKDGVCIASGYTVKAEDDIQKLIDQGFGCVVYGTEKERTICMQDKNYDAFGTPCSSTGADPESCKKPSAVNASGTGGIAGGAFVEPTEAPRIVNAAEARELLGQGFNCTRTSLGSTQFACMQSGTGSAVDAALAGSANPPENLPACGPFNAWGFFGTKCSTIADREKRDGRATTQPSGFSELEDTKQPAAPAPAQTVTVKMPLPQASPDELEPEGVSKLHPYTWTPPVMCTQPGANPATCYDPNVSETGSVPLSQKTIYDCDTNPSDNSPECREFRAARDKKISSAAPSVKVPMPTFPTTPPSDIPTLPPPNPVPLPPRDTTPTPDPVPAPTPTNPATVSSQSRNPYPEEDTPQNTDTRTTTAPPKPASVDQHMSCPEGQTRQYVIGVTGETTKCVPIPGYKAPPPGPATTPPPGPGTVTGTVTGGGNVAQQDMVCLVSTNPIVSVPVKKGQTIPANCINRPSNTGTNTVSPWVQGLQGFMQGVSAGCGAQQPQYNMPQQGAQPQYTLVNGQLVQVPTQQYGQYAQPFGAGAGCFAGLLRQQPPAGNGAPLPGTCPVTSILCKNGVLYGRNSQCVDTIIRTCEFGCNGNACAAAPVNQCPPAPPQPTDGCNGAYAEVKTTLPSGTSCTTGWRCDGAKPTIVIVANPPRVPEGNTARIGWITTGMKSCTIASSVPTSAPQEAKDDAAAFNARNASNASTSGSTETQEIEVTTTFTLNCTQLNGAQKSGSTPVSPTVATSTPTS